MSHWSIPETTSWTLRNRDRGIAVWSLQRALNGVQTDIATDGDFGSQTEAAVTAFQRANALAVDGVAGPNTQRALVRKHVDMRDNDLPVGLLVGFAEMEGGYMVGAVNWSVSGGVDCGVFQRRIYQPDYGSDAVIQRAFDVAYQGRLLADRLVELRAIFVGRVGTQDGYGGMRPEEKAWRLAALNHNYPSAADRLSRTPINELSSYWTTAQAWVTGHGLRFPNGAPVRTPLEWSHLYAGTLAGKHDHQGNVTRHVRNWSTP